LLLSPKLLLTEDHLVERIGSTAAKFEMREVRPFVCEALVRGFPLEKAYGRSTVEIASCLDDFWPHIGRPRAHDSHVF
jgi:hypothetical protein